MKIITINDLNYNINDDFRNIIELLEILKDDTIDNNSKNHLFFKMLVVNFELFKNSTFEQQKKLTEKLILLIFPKKEDNKNNDASNLIKIEYESLLTKYSVNFKKDLEIILDSILQTSNFNVDLYDYEYFPFNKFLRFFKNCNSDSYIKFLVDARYNYLKNLVGGNNKNFTEQHAEFIKNNNDVFFNSIDEKEFLNEVRILERKQLNEKRELAYKIRLEAYNKKRGGEENT